MFYPALTWRIKTTEKKIYLTFDDGPHETATPFVLDLLKEYNAKATFFCIGQNVVDHPDIYARIIAEGHSVGNHTMNHINGWKVSDDIYMDEIKQASQYIHSDLFRPPYGRIKRSQQKKLQTPIIMWDVLSGDFDTDLSPDGCLSYVLYHTKPGSIVVFHDSTKAWERMSFALPKMLKHFSEAGFEFVALK